MALPGYEREIFPMREENETSELIKLQSIQLGRLEGIARLHRITKAYESSGKSGKKIRRQCSFCFGQHAGNTPLAVQPQSFCNSGTTFSREEEDEQLALCSAQLHILQSLLYGCSFT